jgi:serine/threonine protein kinase
LKPENILVCSGKGGSGIVAKLSDFGLSMFVNEFDPSPKELPGGSQPWNSPEWRESRPSKDFYKSDMYSVGLLIWASFSLEEDPFNMGGCNTFAETELLPDDTPDQQKHKIEVLKRGDKVHKIAYRSIAATLASLSKGSWNLQEKFWRSKSHTKQSILKALSIVFENTLRLDPAFRSLQPGIKALETDVTSVTR